MDNIDVQKSLENKISLLEKCRVQLPKRADDKSKASAEYDKQLAITMLMIKNGKVMELGGEKIENPQATLIEKIAKGVCWQQKLEADKTESMYKALVTTIDCLQTELNGKQSILKINSILMN